jgi:hypothetical protein
MDLQMKRSAPGIGRLEDDGRGRDRIMPEDQLAIEARSVRIAMLCWSPSLFTSTSEKAVGRDDELGRANAGFGRRRSPGIARRRAG